MNSIDIIMLIFIINLVILLIFVIYCLTNNKNKWFYEKIFEKKINNIKNSLKRMLYVNGVNTKKLMEDENE